MKYICPMGCEGPKTYPAPGKCPVCGMNLKAIKEDTKFVPHRALSNSKNEKR